MELRLLALYPDQMNIYADRGNIAVHTRRAALRGHELAVAAISVGDTVVPGAHDLFYIGGGQDRDQALCAEDLATVKRDALHDAAQQDKVNFAVCGGYQLLGHGYELDGTKLPGVGLVDLETVREHGPRLIGNVAIELGDGQVLAGFENHGGRTRLGPGAKPLGRVLRGHGNDGRSGFEGGRGGPHATVVGPYLHGPLVPKNAHFADWLTATALGLAPGDLAPLNDALEAAAHAAARRAAGI